MKEVEAPIPIKFKILTIGDPNVGKTSLLIRQQDNRFESETKNTIGIDFTQMTYDIDGKRYDLQIWDTAGQERFRAVTRAYYRDADAAFVVFDVTNPTSFYNIDRWVTDLYNSFKENRNTKHPLLILIGNKKDLKDHRVTPDEIKEMVQRLNISMYISTSAKTGEHVSDMFNVLIEMLVKRSKSGVNTVTPKSVVTVRNNTPSRQRSCCNS